MAHAWLLEPPVVIHTGSALGLNDEEFFPLENGAHQGWLLDSATKSVHVYRPGALVEVLRDPAPLSGELLLAGFILDVPGIWAAMERKPA